MTQTAEAQENGFRPEHYAREIVTVIPTGCPIGGLKRKKLMPVLEESDMKTIFPATERVKELPPDQYGKFIWLCQGCDAPDCNLRKI